MKNVPSSLVAFEAAHQSAGAFTDGLREQALAFHQRVESGGFKEPLLRMKMALSSTARGEMDQLWKLLFQPQGAGSANLEQLEQWMGRNEGLMKAMSGGSRDVLRSIAAQKGTAQTIDAEAAKAEAAVKKAFGASDADVQRLALEARSSGAVVHAYSVGLHKASQSLGALLIPGARTALAELDQAITKPGLTQVERQGVLAQWAQAHPRVHDMLFASEKGYANVGRLFSDLNRVGDWSDAQYQQARAAVVGAFAKAG